MGRNYTEPRNQRTRRRVTNRALAKRGRVVLRVVTSRRLDDYLTMDCVAVATHPVMGTVARLPLSRRKCASSDLVREARAWFEREVTQDAADAADHGVKLDALGSDELRWEGAVIGPRARVLLKCGCLHGSRAEALACAARALRAATVPLDSAVVPA